MDKVNSGKTKVSIIIPVYNAEKYLRKCLDSVTKQTLKDIEIIFVNDGSSDNSLEILNECAKNDDRIKIISQDNQGPAIARENGIKAANGEYIGFLDSDDFISKDYYEILYKNAKNSDADISMTDSVFLYDLDKKKTVYQKNCGVIKDAKIITSLEDKSRVIIATGITWNKIYRKSFLDKYNLMPKGSYPGADNFFNATTVIKANKIIVNHKATYYYVQIADSIVHKVKTRKNFNIVQNYHYIDEWIDLQQDLTSFEKQYWKYANYKRKQKDYNVFYNTMSDDCKNEFLSLINENLKTDNLIISLTSYPARINTVNQTIESLINQTLKPEKIILWLSYEQFPNKENDLPKQLLDLTSKGLTIEWCEDIKSYKKLIPTLKKYPNKIIITADDDIIYEEDRIEKLYKDYLKNPNMIHCHRAHRILFNKKQLLPYSSWYHRIKNVKPSFNNFFTGAGCVLYPINCFYKDILNQDLYMKLCPQADDIWFWAMAVLNNYKINVVEENYKGLNYVEGSQADSLWLTNVLDNKNDIQFQNVLKYYPEILEQGYLDKTNGIYENNFERIFSVKSFDTKKIITICGLKIKIGRHREKEMMERIEAKLERCNIIIQKQQDMISSQAKEIETIKKLVCGKEVI